LRGLQIIGNYIEGANNGIETSSSATPSVGATLIDALVKDNVINVAAMCIDDNADCMYIVHNYCFSDADTGSGGADIMDINLDNAMDNWISGSDINNTALPAIGTLG